ncbi:bacteriocin [Chryseobacterium gallinarum]|uniref:Bacteriocin n=1 Tax=Chryseobacterium gallinarum TaxID=1324352 RepID=A0ABX6KVX6_CHRGL|nr:bacteriocin [Chryseobacterium gallinarum]
MKTNYHEKFKKLTKKSLKAINGGAALCPPKPIHAIYGVD